MSNSRADLNIVAIRPTKGGKFQLTFTQKVINPNAQSSNSIAGLLNASDDRFKGSNGERYAFMGGEPTDIANLFPEIAKQFGDDLAGCTKETALAIKNPQIKGLDLNIQVVEHTTGSDWDLANIEKSAKRAGKDGDYILSAKEEYIFMKVDVVAGPAHSVFLENTVRQAAEA